MKQLPYYLTIISCLLYSCQQEMSITSTEQKVVYDIFPVMGQSNAYNGFGLDTSLDKTDPRIKQLGRFGTNNHQVIPAKEPLEFLIINEGCNSFAMTFALDYLQNYWEKGREVLLIPAAEDGSSFRLKRWNRGDTLYTDVIERIKYVLQKYPGSEVKGFLWHQGENDVYWGRDYAQLLDKMITNMRRDIAGIKGDSIPFLVGGFLPSWADSRDENKITDSVIRETPNRLPFTGYANAREPFVISKSDYGIDNIHFDAAGQREMGKRYFAAYQQFRK